jgi:hypothetical protein
MRFRPHKNFSGKACYYALNIGGFTVLGNTDIWNSLAPKNAFFAWLTLHNRINTRERLSRKRIISDSTCPFVVNLMKILLIYYFHVLTHP